MTATSVVRVFGLVVYLFCFGLIVLVPPSRRLVLPLLRVSGLVVYLFCFGLIVLVPPSRRLVLPLLSTRSHEQLSFASTKLRKTDVASIFILLIARSIGQALGIWPSYGIKKIEEVSHQTTLAVDGPELKLTMPCSVTNQDLATFSKAIAAGNLSLIEKPGLLILFLSAITEPAMLLLLTKKQCPVKPIGAVNVRNRFELLQPKGCEELLLEKSSRMSVVARLERTVRIKKRGYEFDMVVELVDSDKSSPVVFRQTFTILQFEKHKFSVLEEGTKGAEQSAVSSETMGKTFDIRMHDSDPFLWAALCKDYNPIHTSALAARLFGMPGKIAHGNHVVAKAVEQISRDSVNGVSWQQANGKDDGRRWLEVEFKRPVKVPTQLSVVAKKGIVSKEVGILEVMKNDKVHVEIRFGKL